MEKVHIIYQEDTRTGNKGIHSLHKWENDNDFKIKNYIIGLYHAHDDQDPYIEYTYQTWQVRG